MRCACMAFLRDDMPPDGRVSGLFWAAARAATRSAARIAAGDALKRTLYAPVYQGFERHLLFVYLLVDARKRPHVVHEDGKQEQQQVV